MRSLIHQFICSLRRINWEFVANDLPTIFLSLTVVKMGLGHLCGQDLDLLVLLS